ncbi:MAG: hypothetical protein AB8D52_09205 [Gammaproteobacteria bacterium]
MKQIFREVFFFTQHNLTPMLKIIGPYMLLLFCVGLPINYLDNETSDATWFYWLVAMFVQPIYMCRLIKYMKCISLNETPDLSVSFNEWLNLFTVYFLYHVVVMVGCIAFVIPGVYLAARYGFADFEAVLNKKQPMQSMQDSWVLTKSNVLILILGIVIIMVTGLLINILLAFIGKINTEFLVLTNVISELISILYLVLISVFYFRIYLLNNKITN